MKGLDFGQAVVLAALEADPRAQLPASIGPIVQRLAREGRLVHSPCECHPCCLGRLDVTRSGREALALHRALGGL